MYAHFTHAHAQPETIAVEDSADDVEEFEEVGGEGTRARRETETDREMDDY
mgnify:CR=1 FL=1